MRQFGITIVTTPAELRALATDLEMHQNEQPERFMRVTVNWYHSTITYLNANSPEVAAELDNYVAIQAAG